MARDAVDGPLPGRRQGADRRRPTGELIGEVLRLLAGVALVGFLVGAVVGGIGGRLAMRVLAITSDDRLAGLLTDDDPDGFDFTRLSPTWLAVAMFAAIFFGVGALCALGVERVIDAWPSSVPAKLPVAMLVVAFPLGLLALGSLGVATVLRLWLPLRVAGALGVAAMLANWGGPTSADVIRILA